MKIASVGRAFPPHRYDQESITRTYLDMVDGDASTQRLVRRMHERVRVEQRNLALPLGEYADLDTFGKANDAWIRVGLDLGEEAVRNALHKAGLGPEDVDAIYTVTVTGLASPTLDARLVNRMGLRPDVKRNPIFGLGCVAGVAGISRAADYVKGHPDEVAVLLSVELCSLNFQRHDMSVAGVISSGLFADGAAAVVVVGERRAAEMGITGPTVRATRSTFYRDTEDVMGWDISERGFRIVLSEGVPLIAHECLGPDVRDFLEEQGVAHDDVASWVCHPGGPKVLSAMQEGLGLSDSAVRLSWETLAERGNLSSTSVLLVLHEVFDRARPAAGEPGMLVAMGPGFCSELVLLDW